MNGLVRLVTCETGFLRTGEFHVDKLDSYLTIKEAASFLGVSPNTLRNWGRDGKIFMHRNPINGYRLFKLADLETLLKETEKSIDRKHKAK